MKLPDLLPAKQKQTSVLVVDDDPETIRAVREALVDSHWRIDGATDRHSAAALLRDHQSDVTLLNLDVARAEKLDLLWLIRQIRPRTRIILITPSGTAEDVLRAVREHVFSYFSKPLQVQPLKEMIEQAAAAQNWEDGIELLSAQPGWISLRLTCRQLAADRLMQFFRELEGPLSSPERESLGAAFHALLVDSIKRDAHHRRHRTVRLSYFRTKRSIMYLVQSRGDAPSQDEASQDPDPHFAVLAAELLADEVISNERGNEVLLIKYLE